MYKCPLQKQRNTVLRGKPQLNKFLYDRGPQILFGAKNIFPEFKRPKNLVSVIFVGHYFKYIPILRLLSNVTIFL